MSCRRWMKSIPNPISILGSRTGFQKFIKHCIVRKIYGMIIMRNPLYNRSATTNHTVPFRKVFAFPHITGIGYKRRRQYNFQFRISLQRAIQQSTITPLPNLKIKSFSISASQVMMYIIRTNQNRKNIRIHLNDIFFPSFFQIQQGIPTDTPIKKIVLFFRIIALIVTGT